MFCSKCGAQIMEGASFCTVCGKQTIPVAAPNSQEGSAQTAAELQAQQYQFQQEAIRKNEMRSLENAISYFSQKSEKFTAYDFICKKVNYYAQGASSALIVWGSIIASIALLFIVGLSSVDDTEAVPALASVFLIPGLLMIFGGIMMKVCNRRNFRRAQARYAELSKELYDHYIRYPEAPIAIEFVNPEVLKRILRDIEFGRANTIQECIKLKIQGRKYDEIQRYISRLAENTAEANAVTGVDKFFVPESFIA